MITESSINLNKECENIPLCIENNILKYGLILPNEKIVVAVSGGPDSMMLLYSLLKLKEKLNFEICVAHVNHNIRQEAILDENLVRSFCNKNNLELHVLSADVLNEAKMQKLSVEECGRNIRYEFFNKILKETASCKIAVAHNLGDNAETILMNMTRGCGIDGLAGMEYICGNIIRPMLDISKVDIIKYLDAHNILYAIDKTNADNNYTRNYIRNVIIPSFKNINPNFLIAMKRLSDNAKEDSAIINELVSYHKQDIILAQDENSTLLDVVKFRNLKECLKNKVVRSVLKELLGNLQGIELVHVKDITELLNKCITGKKYIMGNKFYIEILKNKKAKCVKIATNIAK